MLGRGVSDPDAIESAGGAAQGLALLPVETILTNSKRTEAIQAKTAGGVTFGAYVIHAGRTSVMDNVTLRAFATLGDGSGDGACLPRVIGTYLHGALESRGVCEEVFGVAPPEDLKRESYDRLADWFERYARNLEQLGISEELMWEGRSTKRRERA
jgi:adenosylcobyric acid synthase